MFKNFKNIDDEGKDRIFLIIIFLIMEVVFLCTGFKIYNLSHNISSVHPIYSILFAVIIITVLPLMIGIVLTIKSIELDLDLGLNPTAIMMALFLLIISAMNLIINLNILIKNPSFINLLIYIIGPFLCILWLIFIAWWLEKC